MMLKVKVYLNINVKYGDKKKDEQREIGKDEQRDR